MAFITSKIAVVTRMKAKEGLEGALKEELLKLVAMAQSEEKCVSCDLHRSVKDNDLFMLYQVWEDDEALQVHLNSEKLIALKKKLLELLVQETDVSSWHIIS